MTRTIPHRELRNNSSAALDRVELAELDRSHFAEAGVLPGRSLRSLDALHVIAALRARSDVFISYDERQLETARSVGLAVESPR